jgi:CheY-like chemotaxis protein/anti-sigma regulatory factor (Ser/Thr protein kinase)
MQDTLQINNMPGAVCDQTRPLRVLLIEDSPMDAVLLLRELHRGGYDPYFERVETADAMQAALAVGRWDIVLSDFRLPEFSGSDALALLKESGQDLPFIMVSGTIGEVNAAEVMRAGAHDYVMKDSLARLTPAITRELREAEDRRERKHAESERARMAAENERLLREMTAAAVRQRGFLKDVLFSVTEGRLTLCDNRTDLPGELECMAGPIAVSEDSLSALRKATHTAAIASGLSEERTYDLTTAVSEAGMNAVVHAGGGEAHISGHHDMVQVRIQDRGRGIDIDSLPRATLERGYTTAGTFGHGFFMMLNFTDRIFLLTGPDGTVVVLEQHKAPPEPPWLNGRPGLQAASLGI